MNPIAWIIGIVFLGVGAAAGLASAGPSTGPICGSVAGVTGTLTRSFWACSSCPEAMPRDIEKGLEAGFFRYLTKPIKVSEFMDTLDLAVESAKSGPRAAGMDEAS